MIARNYRYIGIGHDLFGFTLAAHGSNGGCRRTNKFDSILITLLRKSCIFR